VSLRQTELTEILQIHNTRKTDLQKLADAKDYEALAKFPPPRPTLFLTQPHLQQQSANDFANFSPLFKVYIYSGNGDKEQSVLSGPRRLRNELTRKSGLFNPSEETNSAVIIVSSYQTWATRHGPHANRAWLKKQFPDMSPADVNTKMFEEASTIDKETGDTTIAPHNLEGMFENVLCDEGHVVKGTHLAGAADSC
jgi:hypothetical protein